MDLFFRAGQGSRQRCCFATVFLLALGMLLIACGADVPQSPASVPGTSCSSTAQLQGAGSTFDAPLFSQMFDSYVKAPCGIPVLYRGGGSGAGLNALLGQAVDFAATDVPLTGEALGRSQHGPILHIPVTLGTEAIVYHATGVPSRLKLTGSVELAQKNVLLKLGN